MNAKRTHRPIVKIGSGSGLVPTATKPLPELMSNHSCVTVSPYGSIKPQWVNTLKKTQNGRHFPDDIFKCMSLNEDIWILIKISLRFVPKFPIKNIPALVQIMAGLGRVRDLRVRVQVWVLVICVSTSTSTSTWILHEYEYEYEYWLMSTSTSTSTGLWSIFYISSSIAFFDLWKGNPHIFIILGQRSNCPLSM